MKHSLTFVLLLYSFVGFGQANKWIDYEKQHLEISIIQDGFYRYTSAQLIELGFSAQDLISQKPHIFRHGVEIPISWDGENLRFFAEKNKGQLDSLLYRPFSARPTSSYSLFQDESIYYLRWSNEPVLNQLSKLGSQLIPDEYNYLVRKKVIEFNEQYSFNNSIGLLPNLQQSYYENGEGWTGKFLSMDSAATFTFELDEYYESALENIHIDFKLNGRSNGSHTVIYEINGILQSDTLRFAPFGTIERRVSFSSQLMELNQIKLRFIGLKSDEYDWFSLSKITFQYPVLDQVLNDEFVVRSGKLLTETCENCVLVENSIDKGQLVIPFQNGAYTLEKGGKYKFFRSDLKPQSSKVIKFKKLNQNSNYFIVSHTSLAAGAMEYANYRSSEKGGGFITTIVNTDELYRQFSFGERTPIAIKNYLQWVCKGDFKGKHLFLLGRGVSFPDVLKLWKNRDLVPTFGYPGSDVLLSAGIDADSDNDVQAISTGRLNVTKNSEILNYLSKVKELESNPIAVDWKKNFAHLSGGKTISEISVLSKTLENISPYASKGLLGAKVEAFVKQSTDEVEAIDISKEVNEGLGMIAFAGHGSANVIDLNIGYCSPVENGFNNKGMYPVMYFNGCGVGNVFYRYDPLTTDWLLTPEKGAIAVFANSFWSYQFSTQVFLEAFYKKMFADSSTTNMTLGELHKEVNRSLSTLKYNPFVLSNIHQLILQGDPAIRFFPLEKPDYQVSERSIYISSQNQSKPISQNDELNIGIVVRNLGKYDISSTAKATIKVYSKDQMKNHELQFNGFARNDTLSITVPNIPIAKITVQISGVEEYSLTNNYAEILINDWTEVQSRTSYPADIIVDKTGPLVFMKIDDRIIENQTYVNPNGKKEIFLIDENPIASNLDKIKVEIKNPGSSEYEVVSVSKVSSNSIYELKFNSEISLSQGTYSIRIVGFDEKGNSSKSFERLFFVNEKREESKLNVFPNPGSITSVVSVETIASENPLLSNIMIYDLGGQVIREMNWRIVVGKNEKAIDISMLPPGIYYLKAKLNWADGLEELVKKLIVTN